LHGRSRARAFRARHQPERALKARPLAVIRAGAAALGFGRGGREAVIGPVITVGARFLASVGHAVEAAALALGKPPPTGRTARALALGGLDELGRIGLDGINTFGFDGFGQAARLLRALFWRTHLRTPAVVPRRTGLTVAIIPVPVAGVPILPVAIVPVPVISVPIISLAGALVLAHLAVLWPALTVAVPLGALAPRLHAAAVVIAPTVPVLAVRIRVSVGVQFAHLKHAVLSIIIVVLAILTVGGERTLLLHGLELRKDAIIVLRVLQVVFCGDAIPGRLTIAGILQVFLVYMGRRAAQLHIRPIALIRAVGVLV
jgi:hypothetical protein